MTTDADRQPAVEAARHATLRICVALIWAVIVAALWAASQRSFRRSWARCSCWQALR